MIKLKDLLYEVISWEDSQLNMMDSTMIPLSKKVVDVIVGDVDIPTFHVTDFKGLVNLKKLQGTSKALSTFTTTSQSNIGNLSGIRTDGGFLVHMIGKLKIASSDDIMSRPDETGMRWVSTEPQFPSSLTYLLNKASDSKIGVLHGNRTYLMQSSEGQIIETHSVSAGLDYPGVGPEHSWLKDSGRASYVAIKDNEALEAFHNLCRVEGIIPALESSHALAYAQKLAADMSTEEVILVNLSGRGDKDINTVANISGISL